MNTYKWNQKALKYPVSDNISCAQNVKGKDEYNDYSVGLLKIVPVQAAAALYHRLQPPKGMKTRNSQRLPLLLTVRDGGGEGREFGWDPD
jgi:hypothetical protein